MRRVRVVVVFLVLAFAGVVVASSMRDDEATHAMPDGSTMNGGSMTR